VSLGLDEPAPLETVRLFGVQLARVDLCATVDHLVALADLDRVSYVVTANVDHVVELSRNERFRRAYAGAAVRLADGAPIVAMARVTGRRLPKRVTGADLLPELCRRAAIEGLRVAIVGGTEDVNALAIDRLQQFFPGLDVHGFSPYGFDDDGEVSRDIIERLEALKPKFVFICFGAPRSEIWLSEHADQLPPCVAVCAGAAVDFVAGAKDRAPSWVQRIGMEWAYRLVQEPSRLWKRYLVRDLAFLPIAAKEVLVRLREKAVARLQRRKAAELEHGREHHPSGRHPRRNGRPTRVARPIAGV
jgi:exopolysaccharide biosynthesis WecB/TagA/CpsF family protein